MESVPIEVIDYIANFFTPPELYAFGFTCKRSKKVRDRAMIHVFHRQFMRAIRGTIHEAVIKRLTANGREWGINREAVIRAFFHAEPIHTLTVACVSQPSLAHARERDLDGVEHGEELTLKWFSTGFGADGRDYIQIFTNSKLTIIYTSNLDAVRSFGVPILYTPRTLSIPGLYTEYLRRPQ